MGVEFLRPEIGREIRIAPATAFVASDGNASAELAAALLWISSQTEHGRTASAVGSRRVCIADR
jgi:hypothetical protein